MTKKDYLLAAIFFLAALSLRVWYLSELEIEIPIRGDATSYVQYAMNLVDHGVFSKSKSDSPAPDSYWAPGYPVFIVIGSYVAKLFGLQTYDSVLGIQALLGALNVMLCWFLGRMFLGRRAASVATVLTMICPHLVTMGGYFLSESLFSFLLTFSVFLYFSYTRSKKLWIAVLCGFSFLAAYFVNPVILFAPFLLVAFEFFYKRGPLSSNWPAIALLIIYTFGVSAWQVRGMINVSDKSPSSSDRVYINLVIGSHSDYHQIWRNNPRDPKNPAVLDQRNFKGEYAPFLSAWAERVAERPFHYIGWYFWEKPKTLWSWDILVGHGDIYVYPPNNGIYFTSFSAIFMVSAMKALHPILFLFALGGGVFAFCRLRAKKSYCESVITLLVVYVSAVYVVLQSEPRYAIPLRPEMYLLALYSIVSTYKFLRERVIQARQKSALSGEER